MALAAAARKNVPLSRRLARRVLVEIFDREGHGEQRKERTGSFAARWLGKQILIESRHASSGF